VTSISHILLSRNPGGWAGSTLGYKAGGYLAAKYLSGRIGYAFAGPIGGFLGGVSGYTLEYIIKYATCTSDNKDEI
jgi:hypothetical protein